MKRTFDLAHVSPEGYASALGRDPQRIFAFVRDHVAFEAYAGCLRGARGTLLAMAGNSVDRAALLADLLTKSGQRIRFAHGTLPDDAARSLIDSMWIARPAPAAPAAADRTPAATAAAERLRIGITRDYATIRQALLAAKLPPAAAASTPATLLAEARDHYWVQLAQGNEWVDLDPSFADAAPGRAYTRAETTPAALPEPLFHRLTIRVRVEEQTGDVVHSRTLLSFAAKTADLSGDDIVLLHVPDTWKSAGDSPASALAAAMGSTGQLKAVLMVGASAIPGAPFREKPPAAAGLGGVFASLRGEGTRHDTPIAIAETIEFDIAAPGAGVETITRDVFDRVGSARRERHAHLGDDELRAGDDGRDLMSRLYFVFVTTGRVEAAHLAGATDDPDPAGGGLAVLRTAMRRVHASFAATSDALVAGIGGAARPILFYPDSPRIHILELSTSRGAPRLGLDLRRDGVRAVARSALPNGVFFAQVLRGVVDGTLERVLVEFVGGEGGNAAAPVMSTSLLFEHAASERIPFILLSPDAPISGVADDAVARVRAEMAHGRVAVAPQRAIPIDGAPRWGWWRIDPRTGDTVAVTDEGLHQAIEVHVQHNRATNETSIAYYEYVGDTRVVNLAEGQPARTFVTGSRAMGQFLGYLLSNGNAVIVETVI